MTNPAPIALLTENVVAKTANLVKATAGLGSSGETLGFSGDIQLDIDASITKNKEESTTRKGSTLFAGGNLRIQSGKTAKIEGSDLGAEGELSIDAEDVEITAAKNTEKSSSSTRQAHINGSYSTNGSWGVNADASYSEMDSESTTWANSHLNATNITIRSKNDTTVRGAVVTANERLDLNVGGNLVVESLQDKSSSGSHSLGLSAGYSESKDSDGKTTSSGNFGGNFSVSSSTKKWVTEQTSLTGNSVNIYVENKTTLKGAVIASMSNDLTLNTGSFEYIHVKDKDISWNAGAGVNLGSNSTGKPEEKNNTWSVNASYGFSQKRQTNFATIGEGTIIVRDGNTDLSGLNRDITKAQYGTVDIGLKGGFTVDSSTVALVTSPIKTIKETYAALEKGYEDAAKTTEEIYEKSVVLYEKTTNLISEGHFVTDSGLIVVLDKEASEKYWNDVNLLKGKYQTLGEGYIKNNLFTYIIDDDGNAFLIPRELDCQGSRVLVMEALNSAGQAMNEWGAKKNEEITNSRIVTSLNDLGMAMNNMGYTLNRNTGNSINNNSYVDVNVTAGWGIGITTGVIIDNKQNVRYYMGAGLVAPPGIGSSVTISPYSPTEGLNVGLQGQWWGVAGQVGYGFGKKGGIFWEAGGGLPPGGSLTIYNVSKPINNLNDSKNNNK